MIAVFKREFKACMQGAYGCFFAAGVLLFCGVMVVLQNLLNGYANIEYALIGGEYVFFLAIPLFAARVAAEDRRGQMSLFYRSLPISITAVVAGKYLAMLAVLAIPCAILGLYPLMLSLLGDVPLLSAYIGLSQYFLLGAALLAVCQFLCVTVRHPIVGAMLGVVACVAVALLPLLAYVLPATPLVSYLGFLILGLAVTAGVYIGTRRLPITLVTAALLLLPATLALIFARDVLAVAFPAFLGSASPFAHFEDPAALGIFDLSSFILLLSYPALFLFLTVLWTDGKYRN